MTPGDTAIQHCETPTLRIAYKVGGNEGATPVLLFHGWPDDASTFDGVAPALHRAGFTDRVLGAWEEGRLLERGYGITNLVARATATAAELTPEELRTGRHGLLRKVRRYRPRWVAVLGIGAFRTAFDARAVSVGRQAEGLGPAGLWVLPNPSGLNANHQLSDLALAFEELREAAETARA